MIRFISDLHLSQTTPQLTALFLRFLQDCASNDTEALYILGDLFELWVGDDDLADPFHQEIIAGLANLAAHGVKVAVLVGNRDFLLGEKFAIAAGVSLLPDPYVLSTPEWQFVLSHGDALCLDDTAYMAFRQQVRTPAWQAAFLSRSLAERKAIASQARSQSEQGKQEKAAYLMDVQAAATDDFLREHGYATFIHGHTHQPATHDHIVDGIHVERWVLADWHDASDDNTHHAMGECLCWDGEQLRRERLV